MTPEDYAQQWVADLSIADMSRARNIQTHDRILGVSDIGHCRSYAARFLNHDPFTDSPDQTAARRGTWTHEAVLPVIAESRVDAMVEQEVTVKLGNGFEVKGHVDLIEPDEPSVTDLKTVDGGLAGVKRNGSTLQQKMQRHLSGAGFLQEWPGGFKESDLIVRNVWMDVAQLGEPPHVEQEPYDPSYLDTAAAWVDEVMYTVESGQIDHAPRDKDVFFCRQFCPFVTACRGPLTEVDEVVASDELTVAAALYREGLDLEKEGASLKRAARDSLDRIEGKVVVEGSAGRFRVANTYVKGGEVSYERKPSYRVSVEALP